MRYFAQSSEKSSNLRCCLLGVLLGSLVLALLGYGLWWWHFWRSTRCGEWQASQGSLRAEAWCVPNGPGYDLQLRIHDSRRERARLTVAASLDVRSDCSSESRHGIKSVRFAGNGILELELAGHRRRLPMLLGTEFWPAGPPEWLKCFEDSAHDDQP